MGKNLVVWTAVVGCVVAMIAQRALAVNVKVTPLSGRTMEFDSRGRCVTGC